MYSHITVIPNKTRGSLFGNRILGWIWLAIWPMSLKVVGGGLFGRTRSASLRIGRRLVRPSWSAIGNVQIHPFS